MSREGFAIQAITGNAHFTFDASTDLDVIVGGHLRIRHSKQLTGATWSSSVNIGQKISGGQLWRYSHYYQEPILPSGLTQAVMSQLMRVALQLRTLNH